MENDIVVTTTNLTKRFGQETAVDHVNLEIPTGSIFGFIGPSGCGKTTTVRLLLGVYTPTEGKAELFGIEPTKFTRRHQEKIGYMPQQFVLYPDLTGWENLNFAASIYGMSLRHRADRLHELLKLVELEGHEKKRIGQLSGGMQRRLSLAAALVHNPTLLFMDEPTAGIDPVLRRKFWDYFTELKAQDRTLFVTTQYVGEAAYCDYVGVMNDGRLVMVDTPSGLRRYAQGGDVLRLKTVDEMSYQQLTQLREQAFVIDRKVSRLEGNRLQLTVEDASLALPLLLEWCKNNSIGVESANEYVLPFDDIFVEIIQRDEAHE